MITQAILLELAWMALFAAERFVHVDVCAECLSKARQLPMAPGARGASAISVRLYVLDMMVGIGAGSRGFAPSTTFGPPLFHVSVSARWWCTAPTAGNRRTRAASQCDAARTAANRLTM